MSLNQLPNELIAHIGTFLSFEDNVQFGLSQKRIHAVLKREGLDKPECHTLQLFGYPEIRGDFFLSHNLHNCHSLKEACGAGIVDPKYKSPMEQMLAKFGKIGRLQLVLFKGMKAAFKDLSECQLKLKIGELYINGIEIDVDPDVFVAACKKFKVISISSCRIFSLLCNDKVLTQILPSVKEFNVWSSKDVRQVDGFPLSDKTLQALADCQSTHKIFICQFRNDFTVNGIRSLFEKIIAAKPVCAFRFLGNLNHKELVHAVRWMDEVNADPTCAYKIERTDESLRFEIRDLSDFHLQQVTKNLRGASNVYLFHLLLAYHQQHSTMNDEDST